ncbi:MAG: aspartate aminotransferase family protein [Candidatus Methylacidiphilales bacterium]
MPFDLKKLVAERQGENYDLHEKHLNRTLVQVLRTIGFDKVYTRASGAYLYDEEGRDYLDFLSGYGVFNIGRNHPVVRKAIEDALSLDLPNMVQMDCALLSGLLAEKLISVTHPRLDALFFCNSGTEAVEGAIKFARGATGRTRVLSLQGSYHGLTLGALSCTQNNNFKEGFGPLLAGVVQIPRYNLEILETELKSGDVACFIVELVQGKGVHFPSGPDADFFPKAQALCRQYGALFVCDEVQTSLGRTGKMFAYEHWNLEPDILTVAKALSGGYVPVAAFLTTREIHQKVYSRLDRCVVHSTTFGRNNLAMACGLATLSILEDENLAENALIRGKQLESRLLQLKEKYDIIKEIRVLGLMAAIEFQEPSSLAQKVAWKALHAADKGLFAQMIVTPLLQNHRILAQVAGHHMDVVKILPPLIIGEKEIGRFVNGLEDTIQQLGKFPGPMWSFGANLVKAAVKSGYRR